MKFSLRQWHKEKPLKVKGENQARKLTKEEAKEFLEEVKKKNDMSKMQQGRGL